MSEVPVQNPVIRPLGAADLCWFDPGLLSVATKYELTEYTLQLSVPLQLAVPNVRRWGIGFFTSTPTTSLSVSPWPDIGNFVFAAAGISGGLPFYTLQNFGTLVCAGWYGLAAGVTPVRVVELIRN